MSKAYMRLISLLLVLLFGCQKPPEFVGEPSEKKVWPDLSGTWQCSRLSQAKGLPEPKTPWKRWEAALVIEEKTHRDMNGQGKLSIVGDKKQFIRWDRSGGAVKWFSVNEARRHILLMHGDDGWGYMFVRTEGGR